MISTRKLTAVFVAIAAILFFERWFARVPCST